MIGGRAPVAQWIERRPPEPDRLSVVATRVGPRPKRVEFYALRFAVVPRSGRVAGVARPQTEPLDPVLDEHGATAVDDRELSSEFLVSHGSLDPLPRKRQSSSEVVRLPLLTAVVVASRQPRRPVCPDGRWLMPKEVVRQFFPDGGRLPGPRSTVIEDDHQCRLARMRERKPVPRQPSQPARFLCRKEIARYKRVGGHRLALDGGPQNLDLSSRARNTRFPSPDFRSQPALRLSGSSFSLRGMCFSLPDSRVCRFGAAMPLSVATALNVPVARLVLRP